MVVWTIAALTLREAARRRLLTAVGILTLVMIIFTVWGFSRLPTLTCGGTPCSPVEIRTIAAGLLILVAYMFSVILA
ncbi:MAG: ABC transporter permease, partial [Chloroflexi bacterium]|nr:ABC transporter permease [Chloroflexota bacterium]